MGLSKALGTSLFVGAICSGMTYHFNDVSHYQEKFASLSSNDAQKMRLEDSKNAGIIATLAVFLAGASRRRRPDDQSEKSLLIP